MSISENIQTFTKHPWNTCVIHMSLYSHDTLCGVCPKSEDPFNMVLTLDVTYIYSSTLKTVPIMFLDIDLFLLFNDFFFEVM